MKKYIAVVLAVIVAGIAQAQTNSQIKEIVITYKQQQNKLDCGQTVLDMLGYDGHKMFPTGEVSSKELRSIPGAREVTLPVGREEEIDYNYPKVWIILGKGAVAGKMHWAIRYKGTIYCPTRGVISAEKYKKKYVAYVLQEFEIPVKGQLSPEEYYHQLPPERRPKYLDTTTNSKTTQ